jgi:hypothetical protein
MGRPPQLLGLSRGMCKGGWARLDEHAAQRVPCLGARTGPRPVRAPAVRGGAGGSLRRRARRPQRLLPRRLAAAARGCKERPGRPASPARPAAPRPP